MTAMPDDAGARCEHDDGAADDHLHLDATHDRPELTVFQTAAWVPPAYREAYLEGAASVLGRHPRTGS
ncbi:hypothetical protein [Actinomycetospora aeridis]|uniref:Uncharacterized protein n=1 Tax=Actinomycetospora aeridis TaxID=3129231 RepID=A0ABU8N0J0_9PSEU